MKALATFLEQVENSGYPVRVSALNVRKRPTDPDSYDVNLTISAFDRKALPKSPPSEEAEEKEGAAE
jgi:general secretion pathway protein M